MGGIPLAVGYAGLSPGLVGVFRIDARAPANVTAGIKVPLAVSQGGVTTTVMVRVVE